MSLNEMKARASVPSGLRYLARFWGRRGGSAGFGEGLAGFFGEEKNERMPPLDGGAAGGGAGAGA